MRTLRVFLPLTAALLTAIGCDSTTEPQSIDFTVRVSGIVRDALSGQPVGGAEVTRVHTDIDVNGTDWQVSPDHTTDFTDIQGRYLLTYPDNAHCRACEHHESGQCTHMSLAVTHADFEDWWSMVEILCQSEQQTVPDIELEPLGS